jgi:hypothetical protein
MGEQISPHPNAHDALQTPDLTPIRPILPSRRAVLGGLLGAGGLILARTPLAAVAASLDQGIPTHAQAPAVHTGEKVYPTPAVPFGEVVNLGGREYKPGKLEMGENGLIAVPMDDLDLKALTELPEYSGSGGSGTGKWLWVDTLGQTTRYGSARACTAMALRYFGYDVSAGDSRLAGYVAEDASLANSDHRNWGTNVDVCSAIDAWTNNRVRGEYHEFDPVYWRKGVERFVDREMPIIALIPKGRTLGGDHNFGTRHNVVITGYDEIGNLNGGKIFFNTPMPMYEGNGLYLSPNAFRNAWGNSSDEDAGMQGVAVRTN